MMKSTPPTIPFMRPGRRGIFAALACLVLLVGAHAYTADGLQPASATAPRAAQGAVSRRWRRHASVGRTLHRARARPRAPWHPAHARLHASRGADLAGPRRLRRTAALRGSHGDYSGAGACARRLRRRRERPRGDQRRHRDVSVLVGVRGPDWRARRAQRIGGVHCGAAPGVRRDPQGASAVLDDGRYLHVHEAERGGTLRADGACRGRRPHAADVDTDARERSSVLHGLWQRENLAGPRFQTARGAGPPLCGSRRGAEVLGRAEDARVEVRGRPQHPELREQGSRSEVSAAVHTPGVDEVRPGPRRFLARALRFRAGHRQTDLVHVR